MSNRAKRNIMITLGVLDIVMIVMWYYSGYFRDSFPEVIIPSYIDCMFYTLVFTVPIAILLIGVYGKDKKVARIFAYVNVIAAIILFASAGMLGFSVM